MVYYYFNNTFLVDCGIPEVNLHPMTIDDSYRPKKIACYTPYHFPDTTSVASGNYVSTLTTTSEFPHYIILISYDPNTVYTITRGKHMFVKEIRVYCSRIHEIIIQYKNPGYIYLDVLFVRVFITVTDPPDLIHS